MEQEEQEEGPNVGVLFFYLQWADEMYARWEKHAVADAVGSVYFRTWIGSLYAVVEGWRRLRLSDPLVDRILAGKTGGRFKPKKQPERDETFEDVLRGARHDVFHFSWKHYPAGIATFDDTRASLHRAKSLHGAFRAFFATRAARRK